MNNQVSFDSLLRMAVREMYTEQVNSIPPEDKLKEIVHPSDKLKRRINQIVNRETRNEKLIHMHKIASRVAVIILMCISLSFATLMTAEAVRESVATTILEWHDKFTRIFIETDAQPEKLPEIRFNYIPEGFELVEEESIKSNTYCNYTFFSSDNNFLRIQISASAENSKNTFDNERASVFKITVDESIGTWISHNSINYLIINNDNIVFTISCRCAIEEIIEIYKNIEIL
ncbi:MAG: DUF4367 domain-containing protein [Oscillospiraceae bacterium]|nr:DUF4367 domain-containing protein [Oscillospiraceae bacterium]